MDFARRAGDNLWQQSLAVVAHHKGHAGYLRNLVGSHLRKAPHHDNLRLGVATVSLTDSGAAFLLRHRRHRAGIDKVQVGLIVPIHGGMPLRGHPAHDVRRLSKIQLATQRMCRNTQFS